MPAVRTASESHEDESCDANRPVASRDQRSSLGISRTAVNFVLDAALLVVFVAHLGISAVLRFAFPAADASAGWKLWNGSLEDWSQLHFIVLCVLTVMILLHIMLHWSWICGVVTSRLSKWRKRTVRLDDASRTLYGVGLLIVILNVLGLFLAAAILDRKSVV